MRKKKGAKESGENELRVKVKKETVRIYSHEVKGLSREIRIYSLESSISFLHVSRKNLCGYNARHPLRARFKERNDYSAQFSR